MSVTHTFDLDAFRLSILDDPLVRAAWDMKYRHKEADGTSREATVADTRRRVVEAVYAKDPDRSAFAEALTLVQGGYLVPAGRVNAGAGLDRAVTLTNCFVNETVQDSLPGIQHAISRASFTMQQGGGIGTDWSTVRPAGALVKRTGSVSSGIIPFMDQMSAMCETIVSAGTRRGAMMGTLRDDHPDLWNEDQFETTVKFDGSVILKSPSFISAKRQKGRLTQFNVSILISDAFMKAVSTNADWDLGFHVPRADGQHVAVYDKPFPYNEIAYDNEGVSRRDTSMPMKGDSIPWYVYRRVKASRIWEDIMRSTYVYAEPGVIFIDRVNRTNNLAYCEEIRCTNPCITGDTLIMVAGRGPVSVRQLAEEKADVPVFSLDKITREITVRIGRSPRLTKKNAILVKVHLDDGGYLKVTPDHKFMLRDGREVCAIDLKPLDSLVRVDIAKKNSATVNTYVNGKLEQYLIAEAKYGRKFNWGRGRGKYHVHHINEDHEDNSWDNIEVLLHEDHSRLHLTGDNNPMRRWWSTLTDHQKQIYRDTMAKSTSGFNNGMWGKVHRGVALQKIGNKTSERFQDGFFRERHSANVKNSMTPRVREIISAAASARYQTFEKICPCGKEFPVRAKLLITGSGKRKFCSQRCAALNASRSLTDKSRAAQRTKVTGRSVVFSEQHKANLSAAAIRRYQSSVAENHKVMSVELLDYLGDVYNITVDEHHNYMVVTSTSSTDQISCVGVLNCGEQPLPEHGTCCLSSVNLAFMVTDPFIAQADFNFNLFKRTIRSGVRFLDNVLTVTKFPLDAQQKESDSKRRVGLGVTGFADALAQLGIRYGSNESVKLSKSLASILQEISYQTSAELAHERGAFPLCNIDEILKSHNAQKLIGDVRTGIRKYGLRNGVLNTVAPNGTISLYSGNVSSGIEPIFSTHPATRKVRQTDGSFREYQVVSYSQRLFEAMRPKELLPDYFVGAHDVDPRDHVRVQAAWQSRIDASISKTINCSIDLSFKDFEGLYLQAYESGCKGCTTYRPDPEAGRGSILSEDTPQSELVMAASELIAMTGMGDIAKEMRRDFVRERPDVVPGRTYKIKWPQTGENIYVTVTSVDDEPLEVFIKHADTLLTEWTDGLARMITGVLRRGGDFKFIVEQLLQVGSTKGGAFTDGHYRPSQVAAIASVLEREFKTLGVYDVSTKLDQTEPLPVDQVNPPPVDQRRKALADVCPVCGTFGLVRESGCVRCLSCTYEACG